MFTPMKKLKIVKNNEDPLFVAIKQGNLQFIQNIIHKTGFGFSSNWSEGYTLLCTAIRFHQSEIAIWLIRNCCRINKIDNSDLSETPLHLAIRNNEQSIIQILLEKGAYVDEKTYKGETALHISCQKQNIFVTKLLLKNNAKVDILSDYFVTPLHIAVENECIESIQLLLMKNPDVNIYTFKNNFKGFTALHIAIIKRNEKIIKMLLENGADVNKPITNSCVNKLKENEEENEINCKLNVEEYTPLHLAVEYNLDNIIKLLVEFGANVNAVTKFSVLTPLHFAIQNKNKNIVIFFSENNANFTAVTADGKNVLHVALEHNWFELVNVLLLKGANANIQTMDGNTLLHIAAEMSDVNVVESLLRHNADVNIKNIKYQTPLHIAAQFSAQIVKILLNNGANINDINCNGDTPLSIAIKQKNFEIVEELLHFNPDIDNVSNKAAFNFVIKSEDSSYINILILLLDYGFKISNDNAHIIEHLQYYISYAPEKILEHVVKLDVLCCTYSKSQSKNALLHNPIILQNVEMVKLLIKYKFNLNVVDNDGKIPTDYAIKYNHLKVLSLLLANGAKINNVTHHLLNAVKNHNSLLIQILIKYGANVNDCDEFGTTALHFATWNKEHRLVQFLLNKKANVNYTENKANDIIFNNSNFQELDSYAREFRKRIFTSPLHIAVSKKSNDIAVTLLEHHANIHSKDGYGRTPLHIACAMKSTDQQKIIETLLSYGANINLVDDFNRLPIFYIYNQNCMCSIAFQNQYELYSECECHLYEDYNIDDVISVFVKHIVLTISNNKEIHSDNLKIISKSDFTEKLQVACLNELSKMKEEKICDNVSFYDILIKKSNFLAAYARNDNVINAFSLNNYKERFPLYCDTLKKQFYTALIRKKLLESAVLSFNNILKSKLPLVVIEKIFNYLYLNDLHNISMASECSNNNSLTNPPKKMKVS